MAREVNVPIKITVDQQAAKKSDKALAKTRDGVAEIAEANKRVSKSSVDAGKRVATSYGNADQAVRREVVNLQQRNTELRRSVELAQQYDQARSQTARQVGVFGDIDTSLSTFAGAASGAGLGGAGGALTAGSDIFAVAEQLPLFAQGIKSIGTNLQAAKGPVGALANSGAAVASVIPGVSAGFGAIVAVAGPLIAIAGGAALALDKFNKAQEEIRKEAEKNIEVTRAQREAFVDINSALQQGDIDSATDSYIASLDAQQEALLNLERAEQDLAEARRRNNAQNDGQSFFENVEDRFGTSQTEEELKAAKEDFEDAAQAARVAGATVNEGAQSLRDAGVNVDEINRKNAAAARAEQKLIEAREEAQAAIDDLEQQERDLFRQRAQEQAQINEDRAIRDRRADEDFQEQKQQHYARLAEIQTEGEKKLEDITAEGRDRLADLEKNTQQQIIDAQQGGSEKVAELRSEFAKSELQAEKDYREARQEIIDEANAREFDAILNNDIVAAAQARREEERRLSELDNQFSEERAAEQQAIAERIAAVQQETQQRIAEIRNSYAQERVAIQQQTQERIEAERAALAERLASERKAQAEAEAQRQKQLQRQAEDDKRQDEQRERRFKEELQRIQQAKQAEVERFQEVQRQSQQAIQAAQRASEQVAQQQINDVQRLGNAWSGFVDQAVARLGSSGGGGGRPSGPRRPVPQASGGIMPPNRRIVAEFERERPYSEMVLPLTRDSVRRNLMPVLRAAGGGSTGPAPQINIDMTVGDIASGEQVREAVMQLAGAINQANRAAVEGTGV